MIEWLAILLRVPEIPGSNLGPDTDYIDSISWFSSDPSGNQLIIHVSAFIWRYIVILKTRS
jgi:hypothetical protein